MQKLFRDNYDYVTALHIISIKGDLLFSNFYVKPHCGL